MDIGPVLVELLREQLQALLAYALALNALVDLQGMQCGALRFSPVRQQRLTLKQQKCHGHFIAEHDEAFYPGNWLSGQGIECRLNVATKGDLLRMNLKVTQLPVLARRQVVISAKAVEHVECLSWRDRRVRRQSVPATLKQCASFYSSLHQIHRFRVLICAVLFYAR